ncbi:DNA annealing helicase and endonuclease ZRANB3 [Sesamum angolense]|uniref:DNA annealing helicase and endonuclease ZRANB3 n=1 Tax=Sesamum angolense TaxID=2727404 RepID=A0AAE1WZ06_9LAMI|nr:DNA annealing helicase and endonuclease ZRANB3 [Sesamum angolense]
MENEEEEITEEQRRRAAANRAAALAKRKAILSVPKETAHQRNQSWKLFRCRKLSPQAASKIPVPKRPFIVDSTGPNQNPERFRARLEICSPDSFSVTPVAVDGFVYPGEDICFDKLRDCLANVVLSHYTQNTSGGRACVYRLYDYHSVLRSLKNCRDIECEEIPWGTFNVVERLSHSFIAGKWILCRPEHLPDEKVDELISELPKTLVNALLPFQLDGVRFGLRRGGRCLIADEMGLGKTLQAIVIAGCFRKEGSILVVCPAILRHSWAEELERWFPFCLPSDIHLVFGHQDNPARLAKRPRVVVISYTMLRRLQSSMLEQEWVTLIIDESHHLHCNKKLSEKDELKVVLEVAVKVKHLILLSGTPLCQGDNRPYDIFHQVNMLWPGLLGQTKYEFAKTYCSVKFVRGCQGKVFQDFSRGIRLEELNILLKQSVMVRRLKEHVLLQLPPKRRQIINDTEDASVHISEEDQAPACNTQPIICSLVPLAVYSVTESSRMMLIFFVIELVNLCWFVFDASPTRNIQQYSGARSWKLCVLSDVEDPLTDLESDMNKKLSKKLSALGIAKLPGFFEWLSIHPIMAEVDGEETTEESSGSHKMIVFAYHHKVLDGVQVFLCEKGIQFVRIDCTITGSDRQSAIQSFQSSKEVKVALIGIRAGGTGLNLTSADTVVFLELPMRPGDIQQAEDRAHRHGQKRPVNIYIFCAKDTSDELQWQQLNRSLLRVSSTVNGKHDAIQEIKVEGVSYLETTRTASEKSKKLMKFQNSCVNQGSRLLRVSSETNVEANKGGEGNESTTIVNRDGSANEVEYGAKSSILSSTLRFEVSRHTGRIHLYSCTPGTDSRPRPLFENLRQEEVECCALPEGSDKMCTKSIADNPLYREALMAFINEWKKLRPIEKRKLTNKPLQLPLSCELCYLNESLNHDDGGLLRGGGSRRRKTPTAEISHPLPSNAAWRKVNLCGGHGRKEKLYLQGWSDMDEPLCKLCQTPCKGNNSKVPQFFEDLFCSLDCFQEYRSRTSNRFLREGLFQVERGICTNCQLDCHQLVNHLRPLSVEMRRAYIMKVAPNIAKRDKQLEKLVHDPAEGNAWHADHIIPVYKGESRVPPPTPQHAKNAICPKLAFCNLLLLLSDLNYSLVMFTGGYGCLNFQKISASECKLENMRTLCVACHADVTTAQNAERRIARNKAKKQLKDTMTSLINVVKQSAKTDLVQGCDSKFPSNDLDDDLLIEIPGSAYSGVDVNTIREQNEEQELRTTKESICSGSGEAPGTVHCKKRCQELGNTSGSAESTCIVETKHENP